MPNNPISLQEYISQAQRGYLGRVFGPDFLQKQTYLQVSNVFTDTYGRKVWDALNNRTVFWGAVKKVPFGTTTGWRVRADRGSSRSRPITETGTLPTIDNSDYQGVYSQPRIVGTTMGVTLKTQLVSPLEGGIGDALAVEREAAAKDHVKECNQEILLSSTTIASTSGASLTGGIAQPEYFRVGDTWGETTAGDTAQTFTVMGTNGTLAWTGGASLTDGAIVYVKSRAGFTSIDDIVEEDGRTVAGVAITGEGPQVYNQTARTAGGWNAAAVVLDNNGTARDLSLSLLDTAIMNVRENGGNPRLILLGWDQYFKLQELLQPYQRLMGQEDFVVGVGDERTLPGTRTGLTLTTYLGIPVLPDADVCKGVNASDADLGSNVYVLDTDYLEMAVIQPTVYVDNRDFFGATATVFRGLYYTAAELRCTSMFHQAKICDLSS